ncbi:hypothetical protein TcCL_NonESM09624, partial [Trypanosoma cruzi]
MHHARQQLTRGQTNVPRISGLHLLRWEVKKRRAAKPQKSATTGRNSTERSHSNEFSPDALSLPPSPQKLQRLKTNAPSNKLFVQSQKKPQCLLLPSQS